MTSTESDSELWQELAAIAASARALIEWHASTGSSGLVTDASAEEILAALAPPAARGATGRRGAPPPGAGDRPSGGGGAERSFGAPQPRGFPDRSSPERHAAERAAQPPAPAFAQPGAAPERPRPAAPQQPQPHPIANAAVPAGDFGAAAKPARPAPAPAPSISLDAGGTIAPLTTIVTGSETPEERRVKLAVLADEAGGCTRCGLHAQRQQAVFARGNPSAELCFVGEGPGADEDMQGFPFVGKAGQLLDKMITAMGYDRDDVYICNIVKCRPPENRKPEPSEMAACQAFLTAQLALIKPKVIVALGATAMQGLTGVSEGITRLRGKWKLYKGMTPIMPTFHPAYLLRTPAAKREVWSDLQEVMRFLGKGPPAKGSA